MDVRRIALVGLVIAAGCGTTDHRPRLVTFGHSWVDGGAAGGPKTPWPDRTAKALDRHLDNEGVSATESPQVAKVVAAYQPRRGDDVVIECALNDLRRQGTSPAGVRRYTAALDRMLRHLHGVRTLLAMDPPIVGWRNGPRASYNHGSPAALRVYRAATRRVARRFRVRLVDLGADGWDARADTIPGEGIHPNERGTQLVADRVAAALR